MELFVAPIGLAIVAFVSTNIGNLFVPHFSPATVSPIG
jgi:hypothetical protein